MLRMWRVSRLDFLAAAIALLARCSAWNSSRHPACGSGFHSAAARACVAPHVAFLGRIPGTEQYSDMERHPENEPVPGVIVFRPEASLIYLNADAVLEAVLTRVQSTSGPIRLVVCDLSASPFIDLAGSRMLRDLEAELSSARYRVADRRRPRKSARSFARRWPRRQGRRHRSHHNGREGAFGVVETNRLTLPAKGSRCESGRRHLPGEGGSHLCEPDEG